MSTVEPTLQPSSAKSPLATSTLAAAPSAPSAARLGVPIVPEAILDAPSASDGPAKVRLLGVTLGAGLPIDVVKRVVRQNLGRMRACYKTALAKEPRLQGQVLLDFTITLEGNVRTPHASGLTLTNAPLLACLGHILADVSFPKPDGSPQKVNAILELEP